MQANLRQSFDRPLYVHNLKVFHTLEHHIEPWFSWNCLISQGASGPTVNSKCEEVRTYIAILFIFIGLNIGHGVCYRPFRMIIIWPGWLSRRKSALQKYRYFTHIFVPIVQQLHAFVLLYWLVIKIYHHHNPRNGLIGRLLCILNC